MEPLDGVDCPFDLVHRVVPQIWSITHAGLVAVTSTNCLDQAEGGTIEAQVATQVQRDPAVHVPTPFLVIGRDHGVESFARQAGGSGSRLARIQQTGGQRVLTTGPTLALIEAFAGVDHARAQGSAAPGTSPAIRSRRRAARRPRHKNRGKPRAGICRGSRSP